MSNTQQGYIDEASDLFDQLQEVKNKLAPHLQDVKVKVDKNKNADLYNSIVAIFGERSQDDPDKDYITFEMYLHCLRVVKLASQSTAQQFISNQGI